MQARSQVALDLLGICSRCSGIAASGLPYKPRICSVNKIKPEAETTAAGFRVIKKYPNRRLYDTETSTYITLAEVKSLVMDAQPFVVIDAKSGVDLSRSILLQIILDEETAGVPLFTEQILGNIIRFYGHAMQGFVGAYLEKNMQVFTEMQQKVAAQPKSMTPEAWSHFLNVQGPAVQTMMGTYMEQSKTAFQQVQNQMQRSNEQLLAALGLKR
jgi:polyhydroxyalkanoate synthesis repressor PhaR